jgi:hypothetical protein
VNTLEIDIMLGYTTSAAGGAKPWVNQLSMRRRTLTGLYIVLRSGTVLRWKDRFGEEALQRGRMRVLCVRDVRMSIVERDLMILDGLETISVRYVMIVKVFVSNVSLVQNKLPTRTKGCFAISNNKSYVRCMYGVGAVQATAQVVFPMNLFIAFSFPCVSKLASSTPYRETGLNSRRLRGWPRAVNGYRLKETSNQTKSILL